MSRATAIGTDDLSTPSSEEALDELLSRPTAGVVAALGRLQGDVVILGASGKIGPGVARMVRRAAEQAGARRRVIGVARFHDDAAEQSLWAAGIRTVRCDLSSPAGVEALPDAPNVIFMAGRKFGTGADAAGTWAANVIAPALVAQRYRASRIVVFSSGCVYPPVAAASGGSVETDSLAPLGEYAMSCLARERVFEACALRHHTQILLFRLNYAVELRYGVLHDIARRIHASEPVDVTVGHVNVIWQRDAAAWAIQCLERVAEPPAVLNVTGPGTLSVKALAAQFATLLRREATFTGTEGPAGLLSNASAANRMFGPGTLELEKLMVWVAEWIERGGGTLGKPTMFERPDGRY